MVVDEFEAVDLVREYESHDVSPVEITESLLRRIGSLNEEVNAFCLVDEELALRQARESEQMPDRLTGHGSRSRACVAAIGEWTS
jgi:Asp-tRNA(Asn)/Glu-tRNA(Gln) amidotransferase A subunit family amidase